MISETHNLELVGILFLEIKKMYFLVYGSPSVNGSQTVFAQVKFLCNSRSYY